MFWFNSLVMKGNIVPSVLALLSVITSLHGTDLEDAPECPLLTAPFTICPFPDPDLSVFFPHPDNCGWFFHCSNGVAYCKRCPANHHWNVELQTCDNAYRAGCRVTEYLPELPASKTTQQSAPRTIFLAATRSTTDTPSSTTN
jgi:hypothetical protein